MALSFDALLNSGEVSAAKPLFYERISSLLAKRRALPQEVLIDEFEELSRYADAAGLQESCSIRNVLKSRMIASYLINDAGEIAIDRVQECVLLLKANLFSLAKERHHDAVRDQHILSVLEHLLKDKELARFLKNMSRPISNRLAEEMIRDTLAIPAHEPISDAHVKRACLAAWLTMLRQSLGSCFATAPAILIHEEQPSLFLHDLDEIMSTGRMKKTFGGVEYSVPMSSSWGNGDLKKPIVLQRSSTRSENRVWMSPGLISACESVHILDPEKPLQEKANILKGLIEEAMKASGKVSPVIVTSADEILHLLLLQHHGITQKELDEYLHRPKGMMQGALLLHVPQVGKQAGQKKDLCGQFLKDMEVAKTAFKVLADCPLLKAWEFTLASFSEIKLNFARFNLYTSLGVNYDDPGGIGECIYNRISRKVEQANVYLKEQEEEYQNIVAQMRYLEGRANSASTEKEIEWVKVEYRSRQAELYNIEQLRQMAYDKATKIGKLYDFLITQYDQKFRDYFQEVYDPDIHDIASGPFDDSPAGFRLLYKHGRSNPSQWTRIFSLSEFTEALVSFFTITEHELSSMPEVQGIESDFSFVITELVSHVRSDYFLESSLYRMAKAHKAPLIAQPLQNIDKVEKKPWVYTSGGSMSTLVSAYFRRDEKPFEIERWVESETELFAFMLDTIKQIPEKSIRPYTENKNRSMLIHSPTHAFLLKPGFPLVEAGWTNDMYTYSWIKHSIVEPTQKLLDSISITEEMAQDMIQELKVFVPEEFLPRFSQVFGGYNYYPSIASFHSFVVNTISSDRGLRGPYGPLFSSDEVTSVLYSNLPYTDVNVAKEKLREILKTVLGDTKVILDKIQAVIETFMRDMGPSRIISSKKLFNIAKTLSILIIGSTRCANNLPAMLLQEFRKQNLAMPQPVIFADTNWVKDYFAFVVNPATEQLEFWSVDFLGSTGKPISSWKMWLNGSRHDPKWGIFSKPSEYIGS